MESHEGDREQLVIVNTMEFYCSVVPPWATMALASSSITLVHPMVRFCAFFIWAIVVFLPIGIRLSRELKEAVSEEPLHADQQIVERQCMFARFKDGRWYAIPLDMEDALRKAGAEVGLMPTEDMLNYKKYQRIEFYKLSQIRWKI